MRILISGGSGVLGRALVPLLTRNGHEVTTPSHHELDLFDRREVRDAMSGADALYHLATRIPPPERMQESDAWRENDRLRKVATRVLVDAALEAGVSRFILPSITFVYPAEGPADEDTPTHNEGGRLQSMLDAESELKRFTQAGRSGVILRLGLLWGPGTGNDGPESRRGATLHIEDAGESLRLALGAPAGLYNVVADGERISNARFKITTGWRPRY